MFTGIITAVGQLAEVIPTGNDHRLVIATGELDRTAVSPGESVAVSGVCLTATSWSAEGFTADVSAETLRLTTLGGLAVGAAVNLERALQLSSRLGGHLVSGHVDGVAEVLAVTEEARSLVVELSIPPGLAQYVARKGSVTLDGISLTVNTVSATTCAVNLVPHTAAVTTAASWRAGSAVNFEVDLIARYLERMMTAQAPPGEA